MKIRLGFVSNSSSSSFVVQLSKITAEQLEKILNHREVSGEFDAWDLTKTKTEIEGTTNMDNFDMLEYLMEIGVKEEDIKMGDW